MQHRKWPEVIYFQWTWRTAIHNIFMQCGDYQWKLTWYDPSPARYCSWMQDREVHFTVLYDLSSHMLREKMVHGKLCGKLSAFWVSFIHALIIVHLVHNMMHYALLQFIYKSFSYMFSLSSMKIDSFSK